MLRRPTITANVVDMLPDSGRRGFLAQLVALATGAKVAQAVAEPRVVAYDHIDPYRTTTVEWTARYVDCDWVGLPYGAGGAAYDPKLFRDGVWRPVNGR